MTRSRRHPPVLAAIAVATLACVPAAHGEPRAEYLHRVGLAHYVDGCRTSPAGIITHERSSAVPPLVRLQRTERNDLSNSRVVREAARSSFMDSNRRLDQEACQDDRDTRAFVRPLLDRSAARAVHADLDKPIVITPPLYHDADFRQKIAQRLQGRGVDLDWRSQTLSQLTDVECRIRISDRLSKAGHPVDWQAHSHAQLLEIEDRQRIANHVTAMGRPVDWKDHSLTEMIIMESKLQTAAATSRLAGSRE